MTKSQSKKDEDNKNIVEEVDLDSLSMDEFEGEELAEVEIKNGELVVNKPIV